MSRGDCHVAPDLRVGSLSRIGSHSSESFPWDVVRIDCERRGRTGRYRKDGLMARFGADIALPDLISDALCKDIRMAICGRLEKLESLQ